MSGPDWTEEVINLGKESGICNWVKAEMGRLVPSMSPKRYMGAISTVKFVSILSPAVTRMKVYSTICHRTSSDRNPGAAIAQRRLAAGQTARQ